MALLGLVFLSVFITPASAQEDYSIRVEILSQDPTTIDEGDSYSITILVTNTGQNLTGTKKLDLLLSSGGETITDTQSFSLRQNPHASR